MKTLPQMLVRMDDGELFELNPDGETYSNVTMRREFPNSLRHQWTYEEMMETGKFRLSRADAYERHDTTY